MTSAIAVADPPPPVLDLLHRDFVANPVPMIDRMLREQPIAHDPRMGGWLIGRHRDILALQRDPRLHSNRVAYVSAALPPELRTLIAPLASWYAEWMPMKDAPDHTRLRKLAAPAFQPRNLARLERRVEQVVDQILDRVIPAGQMDVVSELAFEVPARIISDMIGLPEADQHLLMPWTHDIMDLLGANLNTAEKITSALRSHEQMFAYIRELVEERRKRPVDGEILSSLVAASDAGDRLSMQELLTMVANIIVGGYETTAHLIANGTLLLLTHPEQLALVRANPALIPGAIEEMLRLEPSPSFNTRAVGEAIEYQGHLFEPGQILYLVSIAANRDPERFPDPHRFDITRTDNAHLTFGLGIHFCLGAALGRMETRIVFQRMLARLPGLTLAEQDIVRLPGMAMRALRQLVVRW